MSVKELKISEISCSSENPAITGKIVRKSNINKFRSGNGELFSIEIDDESSQIRMVFFNELAQQHFKQIEFGKWYNVSFFKIGNSRFGTNPYELHCTSNTTFTECNKDEVIKYVSIKEALTMELKGIINVIGICKMVSEKTTIQRKDKSGFFDKQVFNIMDVNDDTIAMQVFEKNIDATQNVTAGVVAAFNNLSINEYNNQHYLIFDNNSHVDLNPDHPSVEEIKAKLNETSFNTVEDENLHGFMKLDEATAMFNGTTFDFYTKVKIIDIDFSWIYKSCPTDGCYRKVPLTEDGTYQCDGCNKSFMTCTTAALLNVLTEDKHWMTSFNSTSLKLLEMDSTEFGYLTQYQPGLLKERCNNVYSTEYELQIKAKSQAASERPQLIIESISTQKIKQASSIVVPDKQIESQSLQITNKTISTQQIKETDANEIPDQKYSDEKVNDNVSPKQRRKRAAAQSTKNASAKMPKN